MFLTTPIVRYVTGALHKKGALDADQKASLHRYDLFINLAVTGVGVIAALVYFLG